MRCDFIWPRHLAQACLLVSLAATAACLAGCGSQPASTAENAIPSRGMPSAASGSSAPERAVVMAPGAADRTERVPLRSPAEPAATASRESVDSSAVLRPLAAHERGLSPQAEQAFGKLLQPGIEMAEWDRAQQELLALGDEAVPVLIEAINHSDPWRREMAATVLALMGTPGREAAEALLGALDDESLFVRANAATALVLSAEHAGTAVPVLVELLRSDDPQMRQLAATNLGVLGAEAAGQVERLAESLNEADSAEVLVPVVELLGRIGPAARPAVPKLERIAFEHTGEVQAAATAALELIRLGEE